MEIRKLNMLRGLAALIVLVSHFSNSTDWFDANLGKGAGQFGVMLFFILSGFLMSYLYMERDCNKQNIKNYALARAARVLPLFLLVVMCSYALQKFGVTSVFYDISDFGSLVSHLLLLEGDSVLWTIGPEIHFYIVFIAIWIIATWKAGFQFVLMALTLILLFFMDFPRPKGTIGELTFNLPLFRSLPYFFIGIIIGKIYSSIKVPNHIQSGWYVLALFLIPLMYPKIFNMLTGTMHEMWSDIGVLVMLSLVFSSVVFLVPTNNVLMANKIGDFLGKISYSLYLLHMPVLWQLEKLEIDNVEVEFFIFILSSIVLSYISYKLIELPSSRLIRKFTFKESV